MQQQRRSDHGLIRLTGRDVSVLTWIGEQYAVRLDTLESLLGREACQPTRQANRVSPSTARRVLARWRREEWVATRKFFYAEPEWIWLTGRGLRQLGFTYRTCPPKVGLLGHMHYVNQIRLRVEANYTDAAAWRSERFLRREYGGNQRAHIPDAEILTTHDAVIGVEIELTQKSKRRVRRIVDKLAHRYDCVWFFVNRVTRPVVAAAVGSRRSLFRLYDIEAIEPART